MKKTVLASIATFSLLLAAPNTGMMGGQGKGDMMKPGAKAGMMKKKMMRKKMNSPFLIKHGLPHLTKFVMKNWNDPAFGLTADQKEKLTAMRKVTMGTVMKLKPEVIALKKEIIQESMSGTKAEDLKEKVDKLASLESEATMAHLKCIENTKKILSKDQLLFLLSKKNKMMKSKGMKMQRGSGKCGMGMKQGAGKIATH